MHRFFSLFVPYRVYVFCGIEKFVLQNIYTLVYWFGGVSFDFSHFHYKDF